MGVWSHIIIEGFCFFAHMSKKKNISYELKDIKAWKLGRKKISINECYISPKERPMWCKKTNKRRVPRFRCLCDRNQKRCPFFVMADADRSDYKYLLKRYNSTN